MEGKKLFVHNLSFATTEEELFTLFAEFGEIVTSRIICDRETGSSRGFGFVEFQNARDAMLATEQLDNANFDGRQIRVQVAKPRHKSEMVEI